MSLMGQVYCTRVAFDGRNYRILIPAGGSNSVTSSSSNGLSFDFVFGDVRELLVLLF
jgi:hypothetical protein